MKFHFIFHYLLIIISGLWALVMYILSTSSSHYAFHNIHFYKIVIYLLSISSYYYLFRKLFEITINVPSIISIFIVPFKIGLVFLLPFAMTFIFY